MLRPPATVVVLAWNAWPVTSRCLDALQATLDPVDQIVVVDNGSTDGTADGLRGRPGLDVVTNAANRGFAAGCNQGASRARHPVVVFLNNDTVPAPGWIEGLLDPFRDPRVAAVGPRSNEVSGEQQVIDPDYRGSTVSQIARYAARWRVDHLGERRQVSRLVGFCLAVLAEAFVGVGGFDEDFGLGGCEDDDLCLRLASAGWRLVLADDVFVHHDGHASFDANGLDWRRNELDNLARLADKHGDAAPAVSRRVADIRDVLAAAEPGPAPPPLPDPGHQGVDVSVIVPTFNRPELLRRALTSIAGQVLPAGVVLEVVVVNDGGVDVDLVEFAGRMDVRSVTHPSNRGRAAALNSGIRTARGTFLAFLDDDDVWFPHHLMTVLPAADRGTAAFSYAVRVDEDTTGGVVSRSICGDVAADTGSAGELEASAPLGDVDPHALAFTDRLAVENLIVGMTIVVPADAVRTAGGLDERLRVLEDWELWLRLARRGLVFRPVSVPTAEYRWRLRDNQSVRELRRFHEGLLHVYRQHPVPADGNVAAHRRQLATASTARLDYYPVDVSVAVICRDGGDAEVDGAAATVRDIRQVLAGGRVEVLLVVPDADPYRSLITPASGDVQLYASGTDDLEVSLELARDRHVGRHLLTVRAGESLDPIRVLEILSAVPAPRRVDQRL